MRAAARPPGMESGAALFLSVPHTRPGAYQARAVQFEKGSGQRPPGGRPGRASPSLSFSIIMHVKNVKRFMHRIYYVVL